MSRLRENLTSGSYGEGLETDQKCLTPRQSFTRQLFFKWVKAHLRIKSFYGTSINAVKSQIWIALSIYLLVVIAKKKLGIQCQLYTFLQILEVNLFEKKPISSLVADAFKQIQDLPDDKQPNLFSY